MKASNSLVNKEKKTFSVAITGDSLQNLIKKSVATPDAAARLTGTLISAVAASPQLQNCQPATIVAAALRGEGMGLSLGREYYLVPFADSCVYVLGYRGLIALCLAGNDVSDMDVIEVREGEYIGRDPRTKRPKFDFSIYETDEDAAPHPVIGYYAYIEFSSGRFRFEYMTVQEILAHADRYSKAFSLEKYNKLVNMELSPQEADRLKQHSPYYGNPDAMFKKTVLRKLLNSGFVRLANSANVTAAMNNDAAVEGELLPDIDISAVETTGEIVDAPFEAVEAPQSEFEGETGNNAAAAEKTQDAPKTSRRAKNKAVDVEMEVAEADALGGFFD